jgi:hypothetical protein
MSELSIDDAKDLIQALADLAAPDQHTGAAE